MSSLPPESRPELVLQRLTRRTGLVFPPSRRSEAEAAVIEVMRENRLSDQYELLEAPALGGLVDRLTVGETYFFRDPVQFEAVRKNILPDLLRGRGPDQPVRIWSAGCATGEEAYSLAILAEEEGLADRVRILATDISARALAKARQGIYTSWSLRGDPMRIAGRYFRAAGDRLVLCDRIRRRVVFRQGNLVAPCPSEEQGAFDLVFCRNVLIYFDPDGVAAAGRRLFASLAAPGWLLTGASDPPLSEHAPFVATTIAGRLGYRRDGRGRAASAERQPTRRKPAPRRHAPADIPDRRDAAATGPRTAAPLQAGGSPDREPGGLSDALRQARQAKARGDLDGALRNAGRAVAAFPLAREAYYLHALVLFEARRHTEAISAARRLIFLDRGAAEAHFLLALILEALGADRQAVRAYRNARDLCREQPMDDPLPFGSGETFGQLDMASEARLHLLSKPRGDGR